MTAYQRGWEDGNRGPDVGGVGPGHCTAYVGTSQMYRPRLRFCVVFRVAECMLELDLQSQGPFNLGPGSPLCFTQGTAYSRRQSANLRLGGCLLFKSPWAQYLERLPCQAC